MSSAPQFYIDHHESPVIECTGCTNITKKRWGGDADREICSRHPHPRMKFLFSRCTDYKPSQYIRELFSLIENILLKARSVKSAEDVNGNHKAKHQTGL
jgi:hypothetical protein